MAGLVLVADDEEKIALLVAGYLRNAGFEALVAADGAAALALFRERRPDCAILDINMPAPDGLALTREIRRESATPIILLSARADEGDKILGLELGADDYVTKPFSPRELVSRVRALLRRAAPPEPRGGEEPDSLVRGGLVLDLPKRRVTVEGREVALTALQFDILHLLARSPGRVFSRGDILAGTAGAAMEGYERNIDAHVKNLRKALGDDSVDPRYIGTVRGVGYRLIEPR